MDINVTRNEPLDSEFRETYSRDWKLYSSWARAYHQGFREWLSGISEGRPETQGVTIPTIFATPERAFADYVRPRVESQTDLPVISFTMTGLSFEQSRFRPTYLPFHKTNLGDGRWQLQPRAMPWEINYNVTVWARFYETLDLVSYALMSRFTPKSYLLVNGIASQIDMMGHNDSSTLEPGADQDRILRHDYQFKVDAWMLMPYREVGSISEIILWVTNELNGKNPDGSPKTVQDAIDENGGLNEGGITVLTDLSASTEVNTGPNQIPGIYTRENENPEGSISFGVPKIVMRENENPE